MKDNFKNNLRFLLDTHNMTSAELAEKLNISAPAVSKWLNPNAYVSPTLENLLIISSIFSTPIDVLIKEDLRLGSRPAEKDQTISERVDSAIMALERIREELKKRDHKPPTGGALLGFSLSCFSM